MDHKQIIRERIMAEMIAEKCIIIEAMTVRIAQLEAKVRSMERGDSALSPEVTTGDDASA